MVLKGAFMQQCRDPIGRLRPLKEQGLDEQIADCQHVLPEQKVFGRVFFLRGAKVFPHVNPLRVQVLQTLAVKAVQVRESDRGMGEWEHVPVIRQVFEPLFDRCEHAHFVIEPA
jgi:hypothetical protein